MSNYYYTLIDGKLYYKKRRSHKWKLVTASTWKTTRIPDFCGSHGFILKAHVHK